jgi:hypothetical protein
MATNVSDVFINDSASGIFGLGWPSLSEEGATVFVQNILSQLDEKLFTVWLDT